MLNGLDLFSGIAGISLALSEWIKPVAYCENDRYAQSVLLSRMATGQLPAAPIWDDVRTFPVAGLPRIDIITAGFPCQDISTAGTGKGLAGERSGLFFEIMRLAKEVKPTFIFLENVPAIRTRGLDQVGKELAELRYDCRWGIVSAHDVGAPHLRKRWFCLAYTNGRELRQQPRRGGGTGWQSSPLSRNNGASQSLADTARLGRSEGRTKSKIRRGRHDTPGSGSEMADTNGAGLEVGESWKSGQCPATVGESWWKSEPCLGRVVNGLPQRVDRIKCLGNSVVPAQAREAFKRLMGL